MQTSGRGSQKKHSGNVDISDHLKHQIFKI